MVLRNPKTVISLSVAAIVALLIKFFTAVVLLNDDPTNFLVMRMIPSLTTDITLPSLDTEKFIILLSDENGFVGDSIYYLITHYMWWLLPTLVLIYAFLTHNKDRQSST
jgi:hypothetical protein